MATLLRSVPKRRGETRPFLTKVIRPDGITAFDGSYLYDMQRLDFESFDDMAAIVAGLASEPDHCIVPGDPVREGRGQRRLLKAQSNGDQPTIVAPDSVSWIVLDVDKRPSEGDLRTNAERLDFIVSKLPPEFQDATYFFKWSSSAGRDWRYLSCHLWFWLETSQSLSNLHARASRGGDWFGLIDPAVFTPNQVIYTAAPIFAGLDDPLGDERYGIVRKALDAAPVKRWIAPYQPRSVFSKSQIEAQHPGRQTAELLGQIGQPHYHEAIRAVIANHVTVVPRMLWRKEWLFEEIKFRAMGSGRSYLSASEIGPYLDRLWDGAVASFWRPA